MAKKLSPDVGFNKDAKVVLLGILRRATRLVQLGYMSEPLDIGIFAAHLRDFCCYLDGTGEYDSEGFFGGFDGNMTWEGLCAKLQETSDIDWHDFLSTDLKHKGWPERKKASPEDSEESTVESVFSAFMESKESTIPMETKKSPAELETMTA